MDGITLLVAAGLFVVTGAVVYLISVTGVKGKSYDEAMAEQRRALQESKERQAAVKKEARPRRYQPNRRRKPAPVSNAVADARSSDDDAEKDPPVSTSEAEPAIVEDSDDTTPAPSPPETPPAPAPAPVPAAKKQADKKKTGKQEEPKKVEKEPVKEAEKEPQVVEDLAEDEVEETVVAAKEFVSETAPSTNIAAPPAKKRRPATEKRRAAAGADKGPDGLSLKRVQSLVDAAPLSRSEIQTLIDQLLNKQSSSDWIAKGARPDPIQQLRKQLEEVQAQLVAEQESSASSVERLKQLRVELNQERAKGTQQKRVMDEKAAAQTAETARVQAQEQRLRADVAALQQKVHQLQETGQLQLHQAVTAERLKVEMIVKGECEKQHRELEAARAEHEAYILSGQQRLEERERQYAQLEQTQATTHAELQQLQSIHGGLERENNTLKQQMTELQHAADSAARAQQQLEGTERQLSAVRQQAGETERQLVSARQQADEARSRAEADAAELSSRLSQAQAEAGRASAELQEIKAQLESTRREVSNHQANQNGNSAAAHEEHEEQLRQLTAQLATHKTELESRRKELAVCEAATRRSERSTVKQLLVSLFPTVNADQLDVDSGAWQSQLEDRLMSATAAAPTPDTAAAATATTTATADAATTADADTQEDKSDGMRTRLIHLADEKEALTAQVRHYQDVLAQTESVLIKLEQSVEAEDLSWQRQLAEKQREIDQLRDKLANIDS